MFNKNTKLKLLLSLSMLLTVISLILIPISNIGSITLALTGLILTTIWSIYNINLSTKGDDK